MTRLGEVFDIVLDLTAFGMAQADYSAGSSSINEGYVVQAAAFRDQGNHAQFIVFKAFVYPYERLIPGEL